MSGESEVRDALARLEALHRRIALTLLSEWSDASVGSPELVRAIAVLRRPSWGHWVAVIRALARWRKSRLRQAQPDERDRLVKALERTERALDALAAPLDGADAGAASELARLLRRRSTPRTRQQLFEEAVALRNVTVHHRPTEDAEGWWRDAAAVVAKVASALETPPLADLEPGEPFAIDGDGGARLILADFDGRGEARFVPMTGGPPVPRPEAALPLRRACARLLGQTDPSDEDLAGLIARHAPEELGGVLLGSDYLIRDRVGEGGFADVFRGVHLSTGRRLALKVLRPGSPRGTRTRFEQEGELLSRLNHPHLVSCHAIEETGWQLIGPVEAQRRATGSTWFADFGATDRHLFLALEWVDGPTLERLFEATRDAAGPIDLDRFLADPAAPTVAGEEAAFVARLVRWWAVYADALGHVHEAGLVHRDVKPSNLMLTSTGEPKVMDLGIAKDLRDEEASRTLTGERLGSWPYMAPEQLGDAHAAAGVGPATDLYGLTQTFWELLTRRRAWGHDASDPTTVGQHKREGRPPGGHDGHLPWALRALLETGLDPEPSRRFESAADLRDDLHRFLRDEPIATRPPGPWRRLALAVRRNRRAVIVAALAAVALTGSLAIYAAVLTRKNAELADALRESRALALVGVSREQDDAEKALAFAREAVLADRSSATIGRLREALRLSLVRIEMRGHRGRVTAASLSADGATALTAGDDGIVRLWDAATGAPREVIDIGAPVLAAALDPTGERLAILTADGARLSDLVGGDVVALRLPADHRIDGLAWSPDGLRIATAGVDGVARAWDRSGRAAGELARHEAALTSVAWAPDGSSVAIASVDGTARVVRVRDGVTLAVVLGHEGPVNRVAFSPTGGHLATGSFGDRTARLAAVGSGDVVAVLRGHEDAVRDVAFSPDGSLVATAGADWITRLFDLEGRLVAELRRHEDIVTAASFGPRGQRVVTGSWDGTARIWAVRGGEGPIYAGHAGDVRSVAISRDGARVATAGDDGTVRLFDAAEGAPLATADAGSPVWSVAFDHRSGRVRTAARSGEVVEHDGALAALARRDAGGPIVGAAWAPAGDRVAVVLDDGSARIMPLDDGGAGAAVELPAHPRQGWTIAWSPSGDRVVTGGGEGSLRILEARTGKTIVGLVGHEGLVRGAAFSPDGASVASGGVDRTVRLWDARTGTLVATGRGHDKGVMTTVFSPDGARVLSASWDGTARLWRRAGDRLVEETALRGHREGVLAAVFTPDGRRVVTASADHTAATWLLDIDALLHLVDERLFRPLSGAERARYRVVLGR